MEPVPFDSGRLKPARNRHDRGHTWHLMVETRVEARHGGNARQAFLKTLDERDLAGQMVLVERDDPAQFGDERGGHSLRLVVTLSPMHDPKPDRLDLLPARGTLEPVNEQARCSTEIRRSHAPHPSFLLPGKLGRHARIRLPDALDLSAADLPGRPAHGDSRSYSANLRLDEPPLTASNASARNPAAGIVAFPVLPVDLLMSDPPFYRTRNTVGRACNFLRDCLAPCMILCVSM